MKIVLSVRSDVAYQLLTKLIQRDSRIPEVEFQKRNAQSLRDLEDAVEFYRADLYIVDMQLEESDVLVEYLKQMNAAFLVIEHDVKEIIPKLIDEYGIQEPVQEIHYEREERERVVIQEKIIEKEIIRTAYQAIPSSVVVVGSLYKGAGSTILATNMARMIAERGVDVAYIEHPLIRPYMFDYLQIHNKEQNKPYVDLGNQIHLEGIARGKNSTFIEGGVKWHVNDSRIPNVSSFSYENMLTLSHAVQASVLIVDISDRWLDPEIQKYLYSADTILMCVEPDPVKYEWSLYSDGEYMQRERKAMEWLLNESDLKSFEMILMKNVKGIDIKGLKSIMHKKPLVTIPYISYEEVQGSLFKGKLLYDHNGNSETFEKTLIPVLAKFLPKDFLEKKNQNKKSLIGFPFRKR